jgi:hypothetical protein
VFFLFFFLAAMPAPPRGRTPPLFLRLRRLRVRMEIMGPGKCRIVGKSQSVLMMIDPIIFTHTRNRQGERLDLCTPSWDWTR